MKDKKPILIKDSNNLKEEKNIIKVGIIGHGKSWNIQQKLLENYKK